MRWKEYRGVGSWPRRRWRKQKHAIQRSKNLGSKTFTLSHSCVGVFARQVFVCSDQGETKLWAPVQHRVKVMRPETARHPALTLALYRRPQHPKNGAGFPLNYGNPAGKKYRYESINLSVCAATTMRAARNRRPTTKQKPQRSGSRGKRNCRVSDYFCCQTFLKLLVNSWVVGTRSTIFCLLA